MLIDGFDVTRVDIFIPSHNVVNDCNYIISRRMLMMMTAGSGLISDSNTWQHSNNNNNNNKWLSLIIISY